MRIVLAALLVALAVPSVAHAGDADLKKRLKTLEKENASLAKSLSKEQTDTPAVFQAASAAEQAAGLKVPTTTVMIPASFEDRTPPTGTEYIKLHVRHADYSMIPTSFAAPRIVGTHRLYTAVSSVKRTNRR